MSKQKKKRYSEETKQQVISLYPLCLDVTDKIELAEKLQIESLFKLYNLASRLKVTKDYHDCYNPDGSWNIPGAYVPRKDLKAWHEREKYDANAFTKRDDEYLKSYYGKQHIEEIRFVRGHTETAIAYRARKLGLRKAAHYWDLRRVVAWLGLNKIALQSLGKPTGLEIYPCADLSGNVKITLVSTVDIARMLLHKSMWKQLLERGADEWFIREILESYVLLKENQGEACIWVSHGHTCLNPLDTEGFDWFYDGSDTKLLGRWMRDKQGRHLGRDYHPSELNPRTIHHLG